MVRSKALLATAGELASCFGGELRGAADFPVSQFAGLLQAGPDDASFLAHGRLAAQLAETRAGLVVVSHEFAGQASHARAEILTANPYLFFAQAAQLLQQRRRQAEVTQTQVHPSAVVDSSVQLGDRVRIGPLAVVEAGAVIGADTDLGAGCLIGPGVQLGEGCLLHPRVTLSQGVVLGHRVVIQSGAVLGSDGFGFAPRPDQAWEKIPQTGGVRVGDDVEIGANTVIDRGTLSDTRIGQGVKLDNLIQVAHNVEIGDHTAIAGCVGIAGSTKIGRYCQIGGAAGILGHLTIADGSIVGPFSLVMSSIETPGKYVGVFPLQSQRDWEKSASLVRRLPEIRQQLRGLQRGIAHGLAPAVPPNPTDCPTDGPEAQPDSLPAAVHKAQ